MINSFHIPKIKIKKNVATGTHAFSSTAVAMLFLDLIYLKEFQV